MLIARFFSIAYRMPPVKRLLWRSWYEFLARRYRDRQWTFMNYGYRPAHGAAALALDADDERKRRLIEAQVERPLRRAFHQFAALRGTAFYNKLRHGTVVYRVFVFQNGAATVNADNHL
jgi:hypothetical protein